LLEFFDFNLGREDMLEIMFTFVCVLIYLVSFIYRRISILASFLVLYVAFALEVNIPFVLALMLGLTVIRLKKQGIRDEF